MQLLRRNAIGPALLNSHAGFGSGARGFGFHIASDPSGAGKPVTCPAADQPEKENTAWHVPEFTMRQLLEAGVHFGHQTHRWNPKMKTFIYGSRNGIHIIDLSQTVPLLHQALARRSPRRLPRAAACCSSAPSVRPQSRSRMSAKRSRPVLCELPLAGRHAHQLEDHLELDQASPHHRRHARQGRLGPHQARSADPDPREGKARQGAWRHQGHGRNARPAVRDRHQQGADRHQGSQPSRHSGDRGDRHQFRSRRRHLSDPGQ